MMGNDAAEAVEDVVRLAMFASTATVEPPSLGDQEDAEVVALAVPAFASAAVVFVKGGGPR